MLILCIFTGSTFGTQPSALPPVHPVLIYLSVKIKYLPALCFFAQHSLTVFTILSKCCSMVRHTVRQCKRDL